MTCPYGTPYTCNQISLCFSASAACCNACSAYGPAAKAQCGNCVDVFEPTTALVIWQIILIVIVNLAFVILVCICVQRKRREIQIMQANGGVVNGPVLVMVQTSHDGRYYTTTTAAPVYATAVSGTHDNVQAPVAVEQKV